MQRLLLLILAASFLFADEQDPVSSAPDQVAALRFEDNALIGGVVSPLGGQVVLRKTDLIARGAQDVALGRVYTGATSKTPKGLN